MDSTNEENFNQPSERNNPNVSTFSNGNLFNQPSSPQNNHSNIEEGIKFFISEY
jgi:hypothetical protein